MLGRRSPVRTTGIAADAARRQRLLRV